MSSDNTAAIAAQNCKLQGQPQLNFSQNLSKAQAFVQSLNINHCVTDSASTDTTHSGGFIVDKSSSETKSSSDFTSGCSAVNALMQSYNDAVENVKCIINSTNSSSNTSSVSINSVDITSENGGNLNITCPTGFVVNQSGTANVTMRNSIGNNTQSAITNAIASHIQNFTNKLKNLNPGTNIYGPQGQGTVSLNQISQQSTDANFGSQVTNAIQNIIQANTSNNILDITANGGNLYLSSDKDCEINQDMHINLIANAAVSTGFAEAFKNVDIPSAFTPLPYTPASGNATMYIMLAIAICIFLGCIYYFHMRRKTAFKFY